MVFPDSSAVKNLPVMQRRRKCLGQEDPLEKEMETHPSILVLKNPMDRGAWQSYSPKCHKESDLTEQLNWDCSPPGSSVHGISQARILEWVVISFSKGSSWPRDRTCISCTGKLILYSEPPGKPGQGLRKFCQVWGGPHRYGILYWPRINTGLNNITSAVCHSVICRWTFMPFKLQPSATI